jgi:hypothetical protein
MPYSTNAELPDPVKAAYSDACQTQFRKAFNAAMEQYGDEGKAMATAHTQAKRCMGPMMGKSLVALKATPLDDDAFRLLAFPFGGPLPSDIFPRGVDLDRETFTEQTDIKRDWLPFRPTDWHHGNDPTRVMGRTVLGKAIDIGRFDGASDEPDEDGWWVTVWLDQGEKRLELIRRLAGRGSIFGSSESIPGMVRKAATGEILVWPYWRQTLSTSPQNTYSVIRPLKATLDEIEAAGERPGPTFWSDLEAALRSVAPSLRLPPLAAEVEAKAGRVLSAANEDDLRSALDALRAGLDRLDAVVKRQPDYTRKEPDVE